MSNDSAVSGAVRCFECRRWISGDERAWHGTISYCGDCADAMGLNDPYDDDPEPAVVVDQLPPGESPDLDAIADALVTSGQSVVWVSACSSMAPVVLSIDGDHLFLTTTQAAAIAGALVAAYEHGRDTVIALEPL